MSGELLCFQLPLDMRSNGLRKSCLRMTSLPSSKQAARNADTLAAVEFPRRAFLRLISVLPLAVASKSPARGLPQGALPSVAADFPDSWPFTDADFDRADDSPDSNFYSVPKSEHHIDEDAVLALKAYLVGAVSKSANFKSAAVRDVLDLCASYESYLPEDWPGRRRVAGLGMNMAEMQTNKALTEAVVVDLNKPINDGSNILPYGANEFDLVICALSIDYLTKPLQVMRDVGRVLRPGGKLCVAFSDRLFQTKAIALWTGTGDPDHAWIVSNYIHFAGCFEDVVHMYDISPRRAGQASDPLYVVEAKRASVLQSR
jgi:SAM-dependent methyltransferase